MKPLQIKREIEASLNNENWVTSYDRNNESLKITDKRFNKGVTIKLSLLTEKFKENKEKALKDTLYYINEGMSLLNKKIKLQGNEKNIFPVIRSTSFPTETEDGRKLIHTNHTAETRIFYAVDMGNSFSLIDEKTMEEEGKTFKEIKETAMFNVRSLSCDLKEDVVADNVFYFLHTDDGYDASRILNDSLLREMKQKAKGDLAVATPHQDVLIFADIRNETGYDVLAQMVFKFFAEGRVPITALPFIYENGELEPIFIFARNRPKSDKKEKE